MNSGGIKEKIFAVLNEIPVFEAVILLILTIITGTPRCDLFLSFIICLLLLSVSPLVFRKELSSNRDYRKHKPSNSNWKKPMTEMTDKLFEKLNLRENGNSSSNGSASAEAISPLTCSCFESLNRDLLIFLLEYLTNVDICRLSCVDSRLALILHSDFVWEQIWIQRYGELWKDKIIRSILCRRSIHWDPFNNWGPPSQGWKLFVFEFEYGPLLSPSLSAPSLPSFVPSLSVTGISF
jgi:hypothetical protein